MEESSDNISSSVSIVPYPNTIELKDEKIQFNSISKIEITNQNEVENQDELYELIEVFKTDLINLYGASNNFV